ncbi:MAG: hypothetical protein ACQCN6_01865 [Candidatus Bathyarchaeia archaeon]
MNKINKVVAIALIATFAATMIELQPNLTNAAYTAYPYVTASPNPVGVGQQVLVVFGMTFPSRGFGFPGFDGWTVIITDPNGTTQTLGPFDTDSTGSAYTNFTPDQVGVWKIQAHYPGGRVDFAPEVQTTQPAADTEEYSLTVQQEEVGYAPVAPIPSEYWTFPIYGEQTNSWNIADNWLMPGYDTGRQFDWGSMQGPYNPYTKMPNTPHVLWTASNQFGGMVGGPSGMSFYTGSSYIRALQPPVIIDGRMYWKEMREPRFGWYCQDLATGEIIWFVNGTYPASNGQLVQAQDAQIMLGQVLTRDTRNWHGGIAYLWSTGATTWAVWDAWTGTLQYTIKNAPVISTDGFAMTFCRDEMTGDLLTYTVDANSSTVVKWNSTKMLDASVSQTLGNIGRERPQYNIDWKTGIEWNVTVPKLGPVILQSVSTNATNVTQVLSRTYSPTLTISAWDPKDLSTLILTNQTRGLYEHAGVFEDMAISGVDGHVIWRKVRDYGTFEIVVGGRALSVEDGIYTIFRKETRQCYAFNIATGEQKWISEARPNQWGMYVDGGIILDGKVFWQAYDGELWANDANTGALVWKWGPINAGLETPYGVYPLYGGQTVADGKIIVTHGEHSANSPLYRGTSMYAVNMSNGATIWSMPGWWQQPVVANGIIVAPNTYDGKNYAFGKGPTQTAVTASTAPITLGQNVLIHGKVIDISPGSTQTEQAARFPNGLPAVSDDSMTEYMAYVYQQKPMPQNTTGVPVTLSVVDANGNYREIGSTTSTPDGFYSYTWQPDITGKYTLYAMFAGSESYYQSNGVTAFQVDEGHTATATPTPFTGSATDMYMLLGTIAIIVAIAIATVIIVVAVRKRP